MNPSQWNGSGTALRQNGAKGIVFSPPTSPRVLPPPPSLCTPLLNPKTSAGREEGGNLSEKVSIIQETKLC